MKQTVLGIRSKEFCLLLEERMNVVYSFHGKLPDYSVVSVRQLRYFYDGPIYFIISDLSSSFVEPLRDMNVEIVNYNDVQDKTFSDLTKKQFDKFCYCEKLIGREELFSRAMERFFLLHNLMIQKQLTDIFFVELDNLIYADPRDWLDSFRRKEMAYLFESNDHCCSGICYIQNSQILQKFLDYLSYKVEQGTEFLSEMRFLFNFWNLHPDSVQILPTHWPSPSVPEPTFSEFSHYSNSIFDSLGLGVFIAGCDPCHSYGKLQKGWKSIWSAINYTPYSYVWKQDSKNRSILYAQVNDSLIRVNNLHVHSKDLEPHTSDKVGFVPTPVGNA